jgi:exodeoxyribonuclease V alpha subunit
MSSSQVGASAGEALVGVLERIIFFNEENHYCIAELRAGDQQGPVTVTGLLPGVQCGETLRLEGQWVRHPQHGQQFKIRAFSSQLPATVYGIRKYLGSGLVPGIGKVYANKIVDQFGLDTFRVITEESGLLRKVPGIGKTRAVAIKKAWDDQQAVREVMMFLQTYGVTTGQCLRIVKQYGNEAQQILRNDPYRIAREITGIGFKTADRIAINLGYANDSPPRLDAGILYALGELEAEGHTCYPEQEFGDHAAGLLEAPREKIAERVAALVESKALVRHADALQNPVLDRAERKIAASLTALARTRSALPPIQVERALEWAQGRAGFDFAPEQQMALRHALEHKVSIITGGPGTGKTTLLKALVSILNAKKVRFLLAAPTGRAAQRMADTTGAYGQTIHRLLRFDPAEGGFTVNEDHPLKAAFVVVDEASMLDSRLAASLFQALPLESHLVLVGDIDQLPSVGAGNVLRDLIQSGLPKVTRLEAIFRQRQESLIVRTAHAINQGRVEMPAPLSSAQDLEVGADLAFISATDPADCLAKVLDLCHNILPKRLGVDPRKDSQVLAPMHKGVAGVGNINAELQRVLNGRSPGLTTAAGIFRIGDKLIQLRNNYDKGIFNGDLGTVTSVDAENGQLGANFDGDEHIFDRSDLGDLGLAYAISIHKSQGSEYPVVIIPLLKAHFMMLQRNLLYTAITRGRRRVILVGDPTAYAMAVRNFTTRERFTHLKQKLEKGQG